MNPSLHIVSSYRQYYDDEKYFGADSVHLDHDSAVQAIKSDMANVLEEEFTDETPEKIDYEDFVIESPSRTFKWQIDVIEMPNGLAIKQ